MQQFGPAPPPGLAAPNEHLPSTEAAVLAGHEGAVLAVRFNVQGTYCLSGGKVGRSSQSALPLSFSKRRRRRALLPPPPPP